MGTDRPIKGHVGEPEQLTTKIYYHVDDQPTPYSTEVPIPPSKITLADFKEFINRRNFKFYYKVLDPILNAEVKTDILNEDEVLRPNAEGRYELFLLSAWDNGPPPTQSHSAASTVPMHQASQMAQRQPATTTRTTYYPKNPHQKKPVTTHAYPASHRSVPTYAPYYDDSSSQDDSNMRMVSSDNEESLTSSMDFTSLSQQQPPHADAGGRRYYDSNNKPTWSRGARRRPRRAMPTKSFLSTTFDDTEVSMALDLITVTFNMDTRLQFGMSVVAKTTDDYTGIYVHTITQNSLVALDGRIKPGYVLLEVNDVPLDNYGLNDAIIFLRASVRQAVEERGQLKLTCAKGGAQIENTNLFRLPFEPVRPIDPSAWVQHCNAVRGLNMISEEVENKAPPLTAAKNSLSALDKEKHAMKEAFAQADEAVKNNTMKRGVLTLIQNPITDASTVTDVTVTTSMFSSNGNDAYEEKECSGSLACTFRRLLCVGQPSSRKTRRPMKAKAPRIRRRIPKTPRRFKHRRNGNT